MKPLTLLTLLAIFVTACKQRDDDGTATLSADDKPQHASNIPILRPVPDNLHLAEAVADEFSSAIAIGNLSKARQFVPETQHTQFNETYQGKPLLPKFRFKLFHTYDRDEKSSAYIFYHDASVEGTGYTPPPEVLVLKKLGGDWKVDIAESSKPDFLRAVASIGNARELCVAIRLYALDHNGRYPKTLDQLVASGGLTRERFNRAMKSMLGTDSGIGWKYMGADFTDDSPGDAIVLVSIYANPQGHRVVAHNSNLVQLE